MLPICCWHPWFSVVIASGLKTHLRSECACSRPTTNRNTHTQLCQCSECMQRTTKRETSRFSCARSKRTQQRLACASKLTSGPRLGLLLRKVPTILEVTFSCSLRSASCACSFARRTFSASCKYQHMGKNVPETLQCRHVSSASCPCSFAQPSQTL